VVAPTKKPVVVKPPKTKRAKPPGSGRKKGQKDRNKTLNDEQRKAMALAAGGITPLEYAASVLRDELAPMKEKKWACEFLGPYMHQKLPTAIVTKNETEFSIRGGIMVVPVASDPAEWEKMAVALQTKLKEDVRT